MTEPKFVISLDIDWAPDAAIADALEILDDHGVTATIFATHETPILRDVPAHEIGLHPNITDLEKSRETILDLHAAFPDARGIRNHRMVMDSRMPELFQELGFVYDSNIFAYLQPQVQPYRHPPALARIPIHLGDLFHCRQKAGWDPADLPLFGDGTYVLLFHPIHIYLNTETPERYVRARDVAFDPERLEALRLAEVDGEGIRTLFKQACALARGRSLTCLQVADQVLERSVGHAAA